MFIILQLIIYDKKFYGITDDDTKAGITINVINYHYVTSIGYQLYVVLISQMNNSLISEHIYIFKIILPTIDNKIYYNYNCCVLHFIKRKRTLLCRLDNWLGQPIFTSAWETQFHDHDKDKHTFKSVHGILKCVTLGVYYSNTKCVII